MRLRVPQEESFGRRRHQDVVELPGAAGGSLATPLVAQPRMEGQRTSAIEVFATPAALWRAGSVKVVGHRFVEVARGDKGRRAAGSESAERGQQQIAVPEPPTRVSRIAAASARLG